MLLVVTVYTPMIGVDVGLVQRPAVQAYRLCVSLFPALLVGVVAGLAQSLERTGEELDRIAAVPFDVIDDFGLGLPAYSAGWLGLEDFGPYLSPLGRLV